MLISIVSSMILVSYARGLFDGPYQRMVIVGNLELELANIQKNVYTGIAEDNPTLVLRAIGQLDDNFTSLYENIEQLKKLSLESEVEQINAFQEKIEATYDLITRIKAHLSTYDENKENEYERALDIMRTVAIPYFNSVNETLALLNEQSEQAAND